MRNKMLPNSKTFRINVIPSEFYQSIKKQLTLVLPKLPHDTERKGTLSNSQYKSNIHYLVT